MSKKEITAVGIDVSKGKSTVAVRRPGGEIVCCRLLFFIQQTDWQRRPARSSASEERYEL